VGPDALRHPASARFDKVLFTHSLVSPLWVWWIAHAALGMTASLVYDVARQGIAGGLPTQMLRRARFRHVPA